MVSNSILGFLGASKVGLGHVDRETVLPPSLNESRLRPGPFVSAGGPCSGARTWTVQGLPGSLASHPVAMRTFFDPGRSAGASPLAAPPMLPPLRGRRRHRQLGFRGSIASLHHPLCTLHDVRYRTPCNTRSRLAGSASAGRVSNPLARGEKFQLIASSFPGLALAQPPSLNESRRLRFSTRKARSRASGAGAIVAKVVSRR